MPPKRSNSAQSVKLSTEELDRFNELIKWAAKPKYRKVEDPQELFALFVGHQAWRIPISRLRDTEVKALLALHNVRPKEEDPMWDAMKRRLASDLREFRVADPKSQFVNNAQVVVELAVIRWPDFGALQVPAMVCCNRAMSQSARFTNMFHCNECKGTNTVDVTGDYLQCELCGCFYHENFINNVTHAVGATDVSIHLHCNGCMQREYAEEDDGEDPHSPAE